MAKEATDRDTRYNSIYLILGIVGIVCLAAAFAAEATDANDPGWRDSAREIAGAVFAGVVVAGALTRYEQFREEDRTNREDEREGRLSALAWQREVDIELVRLSQVSLERSRLAIKDNHATRTKPWKREASAYGPIEEPGASFGDDFAETLALVTFLRDDVVIAAFERWDESWVDILDVLPPAKHPRTRLPDQGQMMAPPDFDPDSYEQWSEREESAWKSFIAAHTSRLERLYPTDVFQSR